MRAFAYLIRREFWENKSLYVAPLVVAAVLLLAAAFSQVHVGEIELDVEAPWMSEEARALMARVSALAIAVVFDIVMVIVVFLYLLDALYAERKDRSILFWKSLPVSDTKTVLSKLSVAMVGVPALVLGASLGTYLVVMLIASLRLGSDSWGIIWSNVSLLGSATVILYGLIMQVLWYFPVFTYLLLISAWARRAVMLWALMPVAVVAFTEHLLFRTDHFADLIGHRLVGGGELIFKHIDDTLGPDHRHADIDLNITELIDPVPMLSSPSFWIGLGVGGLFLGGAIWLRRFRNET